ncbi:biotin transporter BioY [Isachenkonia alkalipeptolytica]|nr:biotin transporter BioY [Isachenkonia alkalipeptolytica]
MKNLRELILVSLFAAMTCILSIFLIPLPFTPVPITLQIVGVTLSGAILGPTLGFYSLALYTLLGLIGLPVFAGGGSGFGALLGPTGGYIFGFMAGAYVIGHLTRFGYGKFSRGKVSKYVIQLSAMAAGIVVVYTFGSLQLMVVTGMSLTQSVATGALPFLLPDLLKVSAAAIVAVALRDGLIKAHLISPSGEI